MPITRLDSALAGVLLLVSQVEVWAFGRLGGTAAAAGIAGLAALLMLWRSQRPLGLALAECMLFALAARVSLAQDVEPLSVTFVCTLVTTWFTLGHLTNRVRAVIGLGIGLAFGLFATSPFRINIYLALVLTTFVVPWLVGSLSWMRSQSAAERERLQSAEGLNVARVSADPTALQQLTLREAEVLELMVEGLLQLEDGRATVRQPANGEVPCRIDPAEARRARPNSGCRRRSLSPTRLKGTHLPLIGHGRGRPYAAV